MQRMKTALVLAIATGLLLAGPAAAQEKQTAEPILKHIPADALGFVMAGNVEDTLKRTDKFLNDVGLGIFVQAQAPQGLWAAMKKNLKLGEGFNAGAGVAAIMLDPKDFGIDLTKHIGKKELPAEVRDKLPFVLLLPGTDIAKMLPEGMVTEGEDGKTIVQFGGEGPVLQTHSIDGGYVGLSPNADALASYQRLKNVSKQVNKKTLGVLSKADVAIHINWKKAWPLIEKAIEKQQKQMVEKGEEAAGMGATAPAAMGAPMAKILDLYKKVFRQVDAMTITGRFVETGVVVEELLAYDPASQLGKVMKSYKPVKGSLTDLVPDLPYVMAWGFGGAGEMDDALERYFDDVFDAMLKTEELPFSEEQMKKIKSMTLKFFEQVDAGQFVLGGAPEETGLFGAAVVMKVEDAEKFKQFLQETTKLGIELCKEAPEPDARKLQATYAKEAGKVGDLAFDAIEISHPEMAKMDDEEKAKMKKVFGEQRIRVLVASPRKDTVVVTFGGAEKMLAAALKSATGKKGIAKTAHLKQAMQYLPKKLSAVMLFNAKNLGDVIRRGAQRMGEQAPPINFQTEAPLAVGAGVDGAAEHLAVYVPSAMVKDVAAVFMGLMMRGGGMGPGGGMGGQPPMPSQGGGEDFFPPVPAD